MKRMLFICFSLLFLSCNTENVIYNQKPVNIQEELIKEHNIKSVKVFQYDYKLGKIDSSSYRVLNEIEYNQEGKKVKEVIFSSSLPYAQKGICYYDYKEDDKLNETIVKDFEDNFLAKMEEKEKDGEVNFICYNPDNSIKYRIVEKYDDKNVFTSIFYDENGSISYKDIFKYDNLGLKEREHFDDKGKLKVALIRINDDKNAREYEIKNGKKVVGMTTDVYNEKGQITKTSKKEFGADSKIVQTTEYYENGLLKTEVSYNELGAPEYISIWEYKSLENEEE